MMDNNIQNQLENEKKEKPLRRRPFLEINISELKLGKYKILGTVVSVSEGNMEVNDGTGQVSVATHDVLVKGIVEGSQIRVFGFFDENQSPPMKALLLQNLSGVEVELYHRVQELERSLKKENE